MLQQGGHLKNFHIVNNTDNQTTRIGIGKADIVRIDKKSEVGDYYYAVRFIDVGSKDEERIREFIYRCQRELLKRRRFA